MIKITTGSYFHQ